MDDPRESKSPPTRATDPTIPQMYVKDDANAAIAWYLSDEFEEHLGKCFEEGKRKALDARDRFLKAREQAANETKP